jgi:hypothetical protein
LSGYNIDSKFIVNSADEFHGMECHEIPDEWHSNAEKEKSDVLNRIKELVCKNS